MMFDRIFDIVAEDMAMKTASIETPRLNRHGGM